VKNYHRAHPDKHAAICKRWRENNRERDTENRRRNHRRATLHRSCSREMTRVLADLDHALAMRSKDNWDAYRPNFEITYTESVRSADYKLRRVCQPALRRLLAEIRERA